MSIPGYIARHNKGRSIGPLEVDPTANVHPTASMDYTGALVIGPRVIICDDVKVLTHDHPPTDRHAIQAGGLSIGADVFIGCNAVICPGCHSIGEGAYIAAGAVVAKDVPACEVWGGNPAAKIGDC